MLKDSWKNKGGLTLIGLCQEKCSCRVERVSITISIEKDNHDNTWFKCMLISELDSSVFSLTSSSSSSSQYTYPNKWNAHVKHGVVSEHT